MELQEILSHVDHTLLKQEATWEQIRKIVDEGMEFRTASVCIPASYVGQAAAYMAGRRPADRNPADRVNICTVVGFPNGYSTTAAKCFETADAVKNGADEIDMVVNIGWVKDGRYEDVLREIRAVKEACGGKLLKVIIEACLLTEEEKIRLCRVVSESGAEFIKTSTGFSTGGAVFEDVALMRKHCAPELRIKAAGGISSLEDAERFLALGASRLGTSRIVALAKEER